MVVQDLDASLEPRTGDRRQRGRGMEGRTPCRFFKNGIRKPRSRKKPTGKEMKATARRADLGEAGVGRMPCLYIPYFVPKR